MADNDSQERKKAIHAGGSALQLASAYQLLWYNPRKALSCFLIFQLPMSSTTSEMQSETVNFDNIKRHYYITHDDINPTRIVSIGPVLDLSRPHGA